MAPYFKQRSLSLCLSILPVLSEVGRSPKCVKSLTFAYSHARAPSSVTRSTLGSVQRRLPHQAAQELQCTAEEVVMLPLESSAPQLRDSVSKLSQL